MAQMYILSRARSPTTRQRGLQGRQGKFCRAAASGTLSTKPENRLLAHVFLGWGGDFRVTCFWRSSFHLEMLPVVLAFASQSMALSYRCLDVSQHLAAQWLSTTDASAKLEVRPFKA